MQEMMHQMQADTKYPVKWFLSLMFHPSTDKLSKSGDLENFIVFNSY